MRKFGVILALLFALADSETDYGSDDYEFSDSIPGFGSSLGQQSGILPKSGLTSGLTSGLYSGLGGYPAAFWLQLISLISYEDQVSLSAARLYLFMRLLLDAQPSTCSNSNQPTAGVQPNSGIQPIQPFPSQIDLTIPPPPPRIPDRLPFEGVIADDKLPFEGVIADDVLPLTANYFRKRMKLSNPNRESKTSAPNRGSKTSAPNRGSKTSAPNRGSKTSAPNRGSKTSAPNRGSKTSAPQFNSNRGSKMISNQPTSVPQFNSKTKLPERRKAAEVYVAVNPKTGVMSLAYESAKKERI